MRDGTYTFYTIQSRITAKSPWCKPEEPLVKEPEGKDWSFIGAAFIDAGEPWSGTGNNYKPKYRVPHNEVRDVWSCTGYEGWWTLRYAELAIKRLRRADKQGAFDCKDTYKKVEQAIRHAFRIVKVTVSKAVIPVEETKRKRTFKVKKNRRLAVKSK